MSRSMKCLATALSSLVLMACGGGGGGGGSGGPATPAPTPPVASLATPTLAKYEGVWRQDCDSHMRLSVTLTATNSNIFTVTPKEEHYANADCTGAVVATGGYGKAQETVTYGDAVLNASVKLFSGETIQASIDPATSLQSVASFTFTGSGVTSTFNIDGGTLTNITYPDGSVVPVLRNAVNGETTQGGLLLRNGELLTLIPIDASTTSFQVNRRYVR